MPSWVADYLAANPDLAAMPIHKRAKNSIHFRKPTGQVEAHFVIIPIHYDAGGGNWQPINTDLVNRGSYYSPTGVPIRITNDVVSVEGGTYSQKFVSVSSLRPSTGVITEWITISTQGTVNKDKSTHSGNGWSHTTQILPDGVKETLLLNSAPGFLNNLADTDYACIGSIVTGVSYPDGFVDLSIVIADGYNFPTSFATDANNNRIDAICYAKNVAGVQYLYIGILASWMKGSTYPITLDPNFSLASGSGTIFSGLSATYVGARSLSQSFSTVQYNPGQYYDATPQYQVSRIFLKFDTSSIGGASVISAKLKLAISGDYSVTDYDLKIVKQDWSTQEPLSNATNRETAFGNCVTATLDDNIWQNTSGLSLNTYYLSGALSTSWIATGGSTYYSLIDNYDRVGTAPTTTEYVMIDPTTNPPILVVMYGNPIIVGWPSTAITIPSGWARITALDSKFLKGTAAATNPGTTGGALTHTHTQASGHTHACDHVHTIPDSGAAATTVANDSGSTYAPASHTHVSNPNTTNPTSNVTASDTTTSAAGDSIPTYYTLIFIGNIDVTGIPDKCVAMWNEGAGTPSGWGLCDGGGAPARPNITAHVRGAATDADGGGTGGGTHTHANSHNHGGTFSHTHPNVTSSQTTASANGANGSGASRNVTIRLHTHTLTLGSNVAPVITASDGNCPTEEKDPAYKKLAFIQNTNGSDNLPNKLIAIFTGLLANIPAPWVLCDGSNSTPDMRDLFVKSAVTLGDIGGTGGSAAHSHTATGTHTHPVASHQHTFTMGQAALSTSTGGSTNISDRAHTHASWGSPSTGAASFTSGTGTALFDNNTDTQPPFYTVAFIQYQSSSAIKTVQGTVKASVKSVQGTLIASVKTIDGLA
jgi:hypothetical protein